MLEHFSTAGHLSLVIEFRYTEDLSRLFKSLRVNVFYVDLIGFLVCFLEYVLFIA